MTEEQKSAHEKRIDEFLAEARSFFVEKEAEPVICLGVARNGAVVVIEDEAPPPVIGTVLKTAMEGLNKRIFRNACDRWVESLDRDAEQAELIKKAKELHRKLLDAEEEASQVRQAIRDAKEEAVTSPSLPQSPPR